MSRLRKIGLVVLAALATQARSAVPNTFVAGTTANANAVNANFTDLDGRIAAIESADYPPSTPLTSTASNPQPLGTQVTVAGKTYTITRYLVPGFAGDTNYTVDLPGGFTSVTSPFHDLSYTMQYANTSFVTTISGHTALCFETNSYWFDPTSSRSWGAGLYCAVKLDSVTWLNLFDFGTFNETSITGASPDYSSNNPFSVVPSSSQRTTDKTQIRSLLSYIQITP